MAGLDANCVRTSGYSIFDLGSSFARLRDANGALGANVSGNLNTNYSVDGYMGKVDYNLNDKNTINAKYFYGTHTGLVVNSATITQPYWRPTDTASVQFFGGQWNYIASSAMFNTVRVGYNRFYQKFETSDCPDSGTAPDYGINFGYGTTKPNCGFTNVTLSPFTGAIGCCSSFPKYYGPDNILEVHDGFSYLRGKHNLKIGGEFRNSDIGNGGTFNRGRGQVTFSTLETFFSGTPSGNGQIFIGDPRRNLKQKAMAGYFQDDWRIMPRLMLNLGIRYEYVTPLTEGQNRLANFIPGTGFTQLGVNTDKHVQSRQKQFRAALRLRVGRDREREDGPSRRREHDVRDSRLVDFHFPAEQQQSDHRIEHQSQRIPAVPGRSERNGSGLRGRRGHGPDHRHHPVRGTAADPRAGQLESDLSALWREYLSEFHGHQRSEMRHQPVMHGSGDGPESAERVCL